MQKEAIILAGEKFHTSEFIGKLAYFTLATFGPSIITYVKI